MLACVDSNVVFPFQPNYHTIKDEVTFGKLKQYYRHNETIVVEYTLGQKVRSSSYDFVGMYPVGWQSLEQVVAFEPALVRPADTCRRQRKVVFQPRHRVLPVQHGIEYMFVYVSKDSMQVLGMSSFFMFMPEMFPESQPEAWKGCDEKLLKTGRPLRKAHDGHSFSFYRDNISTNQQYSCVMSPPWIQQSQHHHMGGTSSLVPVCSQCKCPMNYAQTQQNLQAKVRAVTDELHDEKSRNAALEKQLELSRAAQTKLRINAQYANREKNVTLAYVTNVLGSLAERGILKMNLPNNGPDPRQRYHASSPVPHQISHHPSDGSNPPLRPGPLTSRERHLKAIIGSQEATIRDLVRRLSDKDEQTRLELKHRREENKEDVPGKFARDDDDKRVRGEVRIADAETKNTKEPNVEKAKADEVLASGSSDCAVNKSVVVERVSKVDTVQAVVIDPQKAQFGDREVLPDSDDSDGNESSCSVVNDGVSIPK